MRTKWWQVNLLLVMMLAGAFLPLSARDLGALYDRDTLEAARQRYGPNLLGMFEEDFLTRLTREERQAAGTVRLEIPLTGANRSPLDFYSLIDRRVIVIPVLSVKFLDDLSIAYAYMDRHDCDRNQLLNYLTRLMYDERYPLMPPREALGIPDNALDDPFVDDVSQKLLKSTIYFLLGHEYGHIMYRHAGYETITAEMAQKQESQSDALALSVMRRVGVTPMGLAFFFMVASRLEPTPADFETESDYVRYLRERQTHPLSGTRVKRIAEQMRRYAEDFARLQPNRNQAAMQNRAMAEQLDQIGEILNDGRFRAFATQLGLRTSQAAIRSACAR